MNRCMLLAAFLFDALRTPPAPPTVHVDFIDEAYNVTPGQLAVMERHVAGQRYVASVRLKRGGRAS